MFVDAHIIILYAGEGYIVAEGKASAASCGGICGLECKEKHQNGIKVATYYDKKCKSTIQEVTTQLGAAEAGDLRYGKGLRSESDQIPYGARSDSVRRPIRFRTRTVRICKELGENSRQVGEYLTFAHVSCGNQKLLRT